MAIVSRQEHAALSSAAARAELDKCKTILAGDMETVRAAFWNRASEQLRMFVCSAAGLDKKKGKGALQQLDAGERAAINATIKRMLPELENLMRCAKGGKTHDHGEVGAHSFNGIVAAQIQ